MKGTGTCSPILKGTAYGFVGPDLSCTLGFCELVNHLFLKKSWSYPGEL